MLKPIKGEKQYEAALAHIYELMQQDIKEGSILSDELEVISILVKEYELEHYPVPLGGLGHKDLIDVTKGWVTRINYFRKVKSKSR